MINVNTGLNNIDKKNIEETPSFPSRPSGIYAGYKKTFKKISFKKEQTGILLIIHRILAFFNPFQKRNREKNHLFVKFTTFMNVEYMAQGELAGADFDEIINQFKKFSATLSPDLYKKIQNIFGTFQDLDGVSTTEVKKIIEKLEVGKSLVFKTTSKSHAMMTRITCKNIENGKKVYEIEVHNTGQGIGNHPSKKNENGRTIYQTGLQIIDVPGENLFGEESQFISKLRIENEKSENLYTDVLPLAGGKLGGPSTDPRFWDVAQSGGSCTLSCLISILRCHLSEKEYREFREIGRYELFLKNYNKIIKGSCTSTTQKVIALEILKEIRSSLKEKGEEMSELNRIKKVIKKSIRNGAGLNESRRFENMIKKKVVAVKLNNLSTSHSEIVKVGQERKSERILFSSPIDSLHYAYTLLQEKRAHKFKFYINQAKERSAIVPITEDDVSKYNELAAVINKKYRRRFPLNKKEIADSKKMLNRLSLMGDQIAGIAESTLKETPDLKEQIKYLRKNVKTTEKRYNRYEKLKEALKL